MTSVASQPEDFASALRNRFKINDSVDLYDLASKIGLRIKEVAAQGFEGALIQTSNKPNGIVAIKESIRELGRKRFTIAHEFGHYILPGHGITGRTCKGENIESKSKRIPSHEAAANAFASELLLPASIVKPLVRSRLASIETAEFLSSQFGTSVTAALIKASETTHERCCVVMSTDQIIEWAWPNASFKHFINRRERLSFDSLAFKLFTSDDQNCASGLVPARIWLEDSHLETDAKIYEDSIRQPHYNSVLTILTIHEPITQEVSEVEELLEELDPNEFTLARRNWPGRR